MCVSLEGANEGQSGTEGVDGGGSVDGLKPNSLTGFILQQN